MQEEQNAADTTHQENRSETYIHKFYDSSTFKFNLIAFYNYVRVLRILRNDMFAESKKNQNEKEMIVQVLKIDFRRDFDMPYEMEKYIYENDLEHFLSVMVLSLPNFCYLDAKSVFHLFLYYEENKISFSFLQKLGKRHTINGFSLTHMSTGRIIEYYKKELEKKSEQNNNENKNSELLKTLTEGEMNTISIAIFLYFCLPLLPHVLSLSLSYTPIINFFWMDYENLIKIDEKNSVKNCILEKIKHFQLLENPFDRLETISIQSCVNLTDSKTLLNLKNLKKVEYSRKTNEHFAEVVKPLLEEKGVRVCLLNN
ncbi:hypothetical protein AGDE_16846 [Angomonas deanei]|nr:hypothetical protein AGDE_16846 [Angomonas deanei]|eukprot:EPY16073.1 hypothetical protein AGDE_16846 [Angomonas deanei]